MRKETNMKMLNFGLTTVLNFGIHTERKQENVPEVPVIKEVASNLRISFTT